MEKRVCDDELGKVFREYFPLKGDRRFVERDCSAPAAAASKLDAIDGLINLGVKKQVLKATNKVTSRLKQFGLSRRFAGAGSSGGLASRGIEWIYLVVIFLLMAGVINAIGNAGTPGLNLETIVPSAGIQNVTETFIILFGYIVGSLGTYALYLSGRQTIRARSAEMFFIGGIALVAVSVTLGYYLVYVKGG